MKPYRTLSGLALSAMILFAASCGSNRGFSSRKYTAGTYLSHKHKAGKPSVNEQENNDPAVLAKAQQASADDNAVNSGPAATTETLMEQGTTGLGMAPAETKQAPGTSSGKSHRWKAAAAKASERKEQVMRRFSLSKMERKLLAYDEGEKSLDTVALISFIMGVLGLGINLFAFSAIVAASTYFLAILFIAGLVLGILGVVFGTQGLRRHHKSKGATINLVFSIIGTACGGAAIITAFVFSIFTLFIYLASL